MGRLLGACLWHGKPLGVTFATAFCRQVLSAAASVELIVKTAKEPKEASQGNNDDDEEDDDDNSDDDNDSEDADNILLGQFPASLGGGCLGYGAAWRVVRKLPAPAAEHPATAATVAACSTTVGRSASADGHSTAAAAAAPPSSSSSSVDVLMDDTPLRRSKRPRRNASKLASTQEEPPQEAGVPGTGASKSGTHLDSSRGDITGKSGDGRSTTAATAAAAVDETLFFASSPSPLVLIGGAKKACPEGECVLPASMLQCLGVHDGDIAVVTAPARARNRAGRLLFGPPGDKDLWLPDSNTGPGRRSSPGAGSSVTAAFQKEVHCGWLDPAALARTGSSATCRKGNCCADCKATTFPVKDPSTGEARCPLTSGSRSTNTSSSSSSSGSDLSGDPSAVAGSISWTIVPRLKGQRKTKRRQVVPRTGFAEAHDLVFLLALTQEISSDDDDDETRGSSAVRAEYARALGINNTTNHSSSSSRGKGAAAGESNQARSGKPSSLLPLLGAAGALSVPCVAMGARFGFRWCDADLELVVTEVRHFV